MACRERLICASAELADRGRGMRFEVLRHGETEPAFAVRFEGQVHAYLNRCAHVPVQLDWAEGEFFDFSGLYLICATHGATYLPESGRCVAGPCKGARLVPVAVVERNGGVYLREEFPDGPT
jgi:nitrite reductase/ring-hydroxylating ferredoxin subunit